jgi:1D-myo-inositol 3-kinase
MGNQPERHDTPDIVLVGHIARDLQPDQSYLLGGTVTYAAYLAGRHGLRVGVVTSGTLLEAADLTRRVPGIDVRLVEAPSPTIFENRYDGGHRKQFLRSRANTITAAAIPLEWRSAPLALLGPIADEIDVSVAKCLSNQICVATPQGWLRGWDADGCVFPVLWRDADIWLPCLTALVLSVEDVAVAAGDDSGEQMIERWAAQIPYLIVTDGPQAATLWQGNEQPIQIPAFPVTEIDPTGAGDVFTAAFLIDLWRSHDAIHAIRYAHAAASFAVAAPGITGIPSPHDIAARLR